MNALESSWCCDCVSSLRGVRGFGVLIHTAEPSWCPQTPCECVPPGKRAHQEPPPPTKSSVEAGTLHIWSGDHLLARSRVCTLPSTCPPSITNVPDTGAQLQTFLLDIMLKLGTLLTELSLVAMKAVAINSVLFRHQIAGQAFNTRYLI